MKNTVELPKEFVIEVHKSACSDWKKRIEEVAPELFKSRLEAGKWYKEKSGLGIGYRLMFCKEIKEDSFTGYGFCSAGNWQNKTTYCFGGFRPSTETEVFEALKKEAVRRGFKEGTVYKCAWNQVCNPTPKPLQIHNVFLIDNYMTDGRGGCIFYNGKWAEIISNPIPKSLQKAIDKIGKDKIIEILTK